MDQPTTGQYRLLRQADGRTHFAHVLVEASSGDGGPAVRWDVDPGDRASAQPRHDPDLVAAAIAGVTDAYAVLTPAGFGVEGWVVAIKRVVMTIVDTDPAAVRGAAAAATVDAFGFGTEFGIAYDNGWRLERHGQR